MNRYTVPVAVAAILLCFCAAVISISAKHWAFGDEIQSVADGYSHLRFDFRMGQPNPPLAKQIMAFPLLFMRPDFPVNEAAWNTGHNMNGEYAQSFILKNRVPHQTMISGARMMVLALSCLTAVLIFLWTRMLWGTRAAFFALLLYVLSPGILSFSGVAQTEIGITLFIFSAMFSFWLYLKQPSTGRLVLFSVCTGLAFACKVSSVILIPAEVLVLWIHERKIFTRTLFVLLAAWAGALLVLVLDYGVVGFPKYFNTLRWTLGNVGGVRAWQNCFFGELRDPSPLYGPVVLLARNPIPTLLLFIGGIFALRKKKEAYFLWVPAALYFISVLVSRIQQGERFLLPAYPFLFMASAAFIDDCFEKKIWNKVAAGFLVVWLFFSTAKIFPDTLMYFNEFAGGPEKGWKVLDFLDMGQDLKGLAEYMKGRPNASLITALKADFMLEADGIRHQRYFPDDLPNTASEPNPADPEREYLAVSITNLCECYPHQKNAFGWLDKKTPVKTFGHTIRLYDVTDDVDAHLSMGRSYEAFAKDHPGFDPLAEREFARVKNILEKTR